MPSEKHCSRVGSIGWGYRPDLSHLLSTLKLAAHGKKCVWVWTDRECPGGWSRCLWAGESRGMGETKGASFILGSPPLPPFPLRSLCFQWPGLTFLSWRCFIPCGSLEFKIKWLQCNLIFSFWKRNQVAWPFDVGLRAASCQFHMLTCQRWDWSCTWNSHKEFSLLLWEAIFSTPLLSTLV